MRLPALTDTVMAASAAAVDNQNFRGGRMQVIDRALGLLILATLAAPAGRHAAAHPVTSRLRELSLGDVLALLQTGHAKASIEVDWRGIEHGLRMAHDISQRAEQLDHFIRHGATTTMLRTLFKASSVEIKARRKALIGEHRRRRPQLPSPDLRERIQACWWALRAERRNLPPTCEEFEALRQAHPSLNFATLYAVVNEFE
jgi:hypothetical protein